MSQQKKKIALVLAGGASLGAYQVGAIKALTELGYTFDIVTGTSIGALNGAVVAAGQADKLVEIWNKVTPETVMVKGVNINKKTFEDLNSDIFKNFASLYKNYLKNGFSVDISPFRQFVKETIDIDKVYESPIKFGIIAVEFPTFRQINMNMKFVKRDQFLSWIHASSACAPVFPMEKINGRTYVDGFYRDNLPIRLAFKYGADEVFAIDMRFLDLDPQNKFFLSLPNVHYICPYFELGSFLDFDNKVAQKRIEYGYLDVMKYFKKYKGYAYCFKTHTLKSHGFLTWLFKSFDLRSEKILKEISYGIRGEMDETDYYVRTLELLAKTLGINKHKTIFTNDEFVETIKKAALEHVKFSNLLENKNVIETKLKKTSKTYRPDEIKNFYQYLIYFSSEFLHLTNLDGTPIIKESWLKHDLWKKIKH